MRYGTAVLLLIVVLILIPLSCTRAPAYSGLPVASVGDEIITIDFLSLSQRFLDGRRGKKIDRRDAVDNIINNILLSRKSKELGLHNNRVFQGKRDKAVTDVRMKYLCSELTGGECRESVVMDRLRGDLKAPFPAVDWEKVFIRKGDGSVAFMGKLPPVGRAGFRIRDSYCDTLTIGQPPRNLSEFLAGIPGDDLNLLSVLGGEERNAHFEKIMIQAHLDLLIGSLSSSQKLLLAEMETRMEEKLLAEEYRRYLGFGDESDGGSLMIMNAISDKEAREFYESNREGFLVTLWIDISHVRLESIDTADAVYRKLTEGGENFCAMVLQYSTALDKKRCGHVGRITREVAGKSPMFQTFAFTMNPGAVYSIPFRTDDGYEIVKVNDRGTRIPAYGEPGMKKAVKSRMLPGKRQEFLMKALDEMRKTHPVTVYPDRI